MSVKKTYVALHCLKQKFEQHNFNGTATDKITGFDQRTAFFLELGVLQPWKCTRFAILDRMLTLF